MAFRETSIKKNVLLLKEMVSENKRVWLNIFLFILITLVLHEIWWNWIWSASTFLFLHQWASFLAGVVFQSSSWLLKQVFHIVHNTSEHTIYFANGYIAVENACSGLKQFYQLFFLLLLFPGPLKHKIWFIPSGLIIIFLVNIFRILALAWILLLWPEVWDFVHLWVLRPFYYVVIFLIWMIWVEKFRNPSISNQS